MSQLTPLFMAVTGLSEHDIASIIRTAPARYKTYLIEKRNGGLRVISQPAREVKALQRALVAHILQHLPVHPAATAYQPQTSIRMNALAHAANGPILKFDFSDFFPSLMARDWETYCRAHAIFNDPIDIGISARILFHQGKSGGPLRLAIGAPSSPRLSNILMHDLDTQIAAAMSQEQVTYTRYADDLTFSARRTGYLTGVEKTLRLLIRNCRSPYLRINEAKTVLATKKYRRVVTGITLTNDGRISIGHDRKRSIRAALHHATLSQLSPAELSRLSGLIAFAQDVEPDFYARMVARYGMELIRTIKAAPHQSGDLDE